MNNRIADELVIRGVDDWIQAAEVVSVVISDGNVTSFVNERDIALRAVREVVEGGLMVLGDVVPSDGFRPWDLITAGALGRVERDWAALGRRPVIGELFWLANTPAGDVRGKLLRTARRPTDSDA